MTRAHPSFAPIGLAMTAVVLGAVAFAGLSALSQPSRLSPRVEAVRANVAVAGSVGKKAGTEALPVVCDRAVNAAIARLRGDLTLAAAARGVELTNMIVAEEASRGDGLSSGSLVLKARGSQEAAMGFVQVLGMEEPSLRIRRVEMRPREGGVELSLEGAIWCAG